MKSNIFDLEQSILQCWNVCDDLDLLYSQTMERSTPLTQDEMANILLGMKSLYQLKFQKCFAEFESFCSDYHKYRKMYELVQRAKDDLK
jgi:hypothetical protein